MEQRMIWRHQEISETTRSGKNQQPYIFPHDSICVGLTDNQISLQEYAFFNKLMMDQKDTQ